MKKSVIYASVLNNFLFIIGYQYVPFTTIWSWIVFACFICQLISVVNILGEYHLTPKNQIFAWMNYGIYLILYALFLIKFKYQIHIPMFTGIYGLFSCVSILMLYCINIKQKLYTSQGEPLSQKEIEDYVFRSITSRRNYHINHYKKTQIDVTILNALTIILMFVLPMICNVLYEVFAMKAMIWIILLFFIFTLINAVKYKYAAISYRRYFIDMFYAIVSMIYFSIFYTYFNDVGFVKMLNTFYLLVPYILTCYGMGQVYQFSKNK